MKVSPDTRTPRATRVPVCQLALLALLSLSFLAGCSDSGGSAPASSDNSADSSADMADTAMADSSMDGTDMADSSMDGTDMGHVPMADDGSGDPPPLDPGGDDGNMPADYSSDGSSSGYDSPSAEYDPSLAGSTDGTEPVSSGDYDPSAAIDPDSPSADYSPDASIDPGSPSADYSPDASIDPSSPSAEYNPDDASSGDGTDSPSATLDGGEYSEGASADIGSGTGTDGGQQAQAPPEGTPEHPAFHLVMGLREGEYDGLKEHISSRARDDLMKMRAGKLSAADKEKYKKALESPQLLSNRSKSGGRQLSLKSGESAITILVKKEGGAWKVAELTLRKATSRSR